MEQQKQEMTFAQRLKAGWDDFRQTNLRAQAHYAVFRATQNIKQKNGLVARYKQRFLANWETWLGIGAGVTGLLMLLTPDSLWRWQLLLAILAILAAPLLADMWHSLKKIFTEYPGKQFIGQVITLEQPIVEGKGQIRLDNQEWQLAGIDCPAETRVKVIAIRDRTLYIKPLEQPE